MGNYNKKVYIFIMRTDFMCFGCPRCNLLSADAGLPGTRFLEARGSLNGPFHPGRAGADAKNDSQRAAAVCFWHGPLLLLLLWAGGGHLWELVVVVGGFGTTCPQ